MLNNVPLSTKLLLGAIVVAFFLRTHLGLGVMDLSSQENVQTKTAALNYFEVWNKQDLKGLTELFAESATLRDWDIEVFGRKAVVDANGNIFKNVPNIKITVLNVITSVHQKTGLPIAACELSIYVDDKTTLKVTDILEYDANLKLTAVRAYKG